MARFSLYLDIARGFEAISVEAARSLTWRPVSLLIRCLRCNTPPLTAQSVGLRPHRCFWRAVLITLCRSTYADELTISKSVCSVNTRQHRKNVSAACTVYRGIEKQLDQIHRRGGGQEFNPASCISVDTMLTLHYTPTDSPELPGSNRYGEDLESSTPITELPCTDWKIQWHHYRRDEKHCQ